MGLAFVPLYINYLGIEAYGLVGLFTLLQSWLTLLDMGMTPTLSREIALFKGGRHNAHSIRDLLRSIEWIALAIAVLIAAGIALCSDLIATQWLQTEALSLSVVTQALIVMGLVTALRFVEGIYRSTMIGFQRQVLLNAVTSAMSTLRGLGAVAVLAWVSPTIQAFFIWQGVISAATLAILASSTYATIPRGERKGRFSPDALRAVSRFAGGMTGITLLALMLTQIDKILLSRLLTMSEYGYYNLAASVAGAIFMLITPVTQIFSPRLCELHARNDERTMIETYHQGAQLISVTAGSVAIVMILFSETFLRLWTQDIELSVRIAPLLRLLMLGNLLNGLMVMPYQLQLAQGWTSFTERINVIAVIIIVPAILYVTPRYGPVGAAWVWVGLNAGYVLLGVNLMYRRFLIREKWFWYKNDVLMPLGAGFLGAGLVSELSTNQSDVLSDLVQLTLATFMSLSTAILGSTYTRSRLAEWVNPYWTKWKNRHDN